MTDEQILNLSLEHGVCDRDLSRDGYFCTDYGLANNEILAFARALLAAGNSQPLQAVRDEALEQERKANRLLREVIFNLMTVKGRHNTEIAFSRLEKAYFEAVKSSPVIAPAQHGEKKS